MYRYVNDCNAPSTQLMILVSMQYCTVEEPVRRKVFTSSSLAVASKLKGFEVIPEEVDFGVLREGSTYSFKFNLKNTGIELSHFKIKQPPPSTGIKVVYNPGAVSGHTAVLLGNKQTQKCPPHLPHHYPLSPSPPPLL